MGHEKIIPSSINDRVLILSCCCSACFPDRCRGRCSIVSPEFYVLILRKGGQEKTINGIKDSSSTAISFIVEGN